MFAALVPYSPSRDLVRWRICGCCIRNVGCWCTVRRCAPPTLARVAPMDVTLDIKKGGLPPEMRKSAHLRRICHSQISQKLNVTCPPLTGTTYTMQFNVFYACAEISGNECQGTYLNP